MPDSATRFAHLVLVGCGHMGGALLTRWAHQEPTTRFSVIDRSPNVAVAQPPFPSPRVRFHDSLQDFQRNGDRDFDALLLAVRPAQVLRALDAFLPLCAKQTAILSLAAGLPLKDLRAKLDKTTPLFRVMPSIPVAISEGIVIVARDRQCPVAEQKTERLFSSLGLFSMGGEDNLDKTSGLWGSGPGYVFVMLAAFEQAARSLGVEPAAARQLAVQSLKGASLYAEKAYKENHQTSPRELVASIALKGGTTEAGLVILDDAEKGLCALMEHTAQRAYQRATAMAKDLAQGDN